MSMTNSLYDTLKFIAQIVLPALATFYTTISSIWGLPYGTEVGSTIMAVDTLLGATLMISSSQYKEAQNGETKQDDVAR